MSVGAEHASGERYCPSCERTFASGERCPNDGTRLVKLAQHSLIGRELDGRYRLVEKLGEGAMGTVYLAHQLPAGREVAIKVVTPSLVSDATAIKRFLREAKLASRLIHPNIVAVLDFGQTDDGLFYLVMELVVGKTLDKLIEKHGAMAPERVVKIGVQVLVALEAAHALPIVHRDLKPANVMVCEGDRVKVLDFGLAKSLVPDIDKATMTNAGSLLGTPAFMPPEAVSGSAYDERSDIYSLGCVLYAAVMGDQPFVASTVHELIAMHASEPPPPMTGVPGGLAAVIQQMLEKSPDRRFRNAEKTREALERSLDLGGEHEPVDPTLVSGMGSTMLGWGGQPVVPPKQVARMTQPEPARLRRPIWPFVLALVLAAAAGAAAYLLLT